VIEFPPYWTPEQFRAFVDFVPPKQYKLAFSLAFYAGLRLREQHIVVSSHDDFRTKSDNSRRIPIAPALADELDAYTAREGGATWVPLANEPSTRINAITQPTPGIATAVGVEGVIVRTTDGGESWTTQGKIERYHQTMKNLIKLDPYYYPEELERALGSFVDWYNNERYHVALCNRRPVYVYKG
jgi:hypothetical protein